MAESLAIVVADVDVLVTDALADLLERHGHRVRIAPPVHAAVRDWVRNFHADVAIVDLALRDGADVAEIGRLQSEFPATKVVVRTASTSAETMRAALAAGAVGYLHKSRGPQVLLELLARVADGEVVVEGSFSRSAAPSTEHQVDVGRLIGSLTPRQRECLAMIVQGKGTLAMAHQLGVSTMTVRSHVQAVLGKLGVRSRLEAASLAAGHRIIDPEGRVLNGPDGHAGASADPARVGPDHDGAVRSR